MGATQSEPEAPAREHIDLEDHNALRQALESNIAYVVEQLGYRTSYVADNVRLLLGTCMCALVATAHLLPGKFPAHAAPLAVCVTTYYAVAALAWLWGAVAVRDVFMHALPRKPDPPGSAPLRLRLDFPRNGTRFMLIVERGSKLTKAGEADAARYFHADGYLAQEKLWGWARRQLEALPLEGTATKAD